MSKCKLLMLVALCVAGGSIRGVEGNNTISYRHMPPVYRLEDFDDCLQLSDPAYCLIDIQLSGSPDNVLYQLIQNSSVDLKRQVPHSVLKRGVCANSWYDKKQKRPPGLHHKSLQLAMEHYAKQTIGLPYKLNTNVSHMNCRGKEWLPRFALADILFYMIAFTIGVLIFVGSFFAKGDTGGARFAQCFSICQNWSLLMRLPNPDTPGLHGFRYLTLQGMLILHVMAACDNTYVYNTQYMENRAQYPMEFPSLNYTTTMQTFLCISGFFLSYNFFKRLGDRVFSLWVFPYEIIKYYLRFTPAYALVLGYYATKFVRTYDGPLWAATAGAEATACKKHMWEHLLYYNNYVRHEQECFSDSWYFALEFQLFVLGLAVLMFIWRFPFLAKQVFGALLITAVLVPVYLVYVNDLFPYHTSFTDSLRTNNYNNKEFRRLFVTVEGNAVGYVIGMIGGYLHYQGKQANLKLDTYARFQQWVGWSPCLNLGSLLLGSLFQWRTYVYSPITAALYCLLLRPLNALIGTTLLMGLFNNVKQPLMSLFRSRLLHVPGKLTYSAFLISNVAMVTLMGQISQPLYMYDAILGTMCYGTVALIMLACVSFYVMVEMPVRRIQEMLMPQLTLQAAKTTQGSKDTNTTIITSSAANITSNTVSTISGAINGSTTNLTQSTETLSTIAQSTESLDRKDVPGYDSKVI